MKRKLFVFICSLVLLLSIHTIAFAGTQSVSLSLGSTQTISIASGTTSLNVTGSTSSGKAWISCSLGGRSGSSSSSHEYATLSVSGLASGSYTLSVTAYELKTTKEATTSGGTLIYTVKYSKGSRIGSYSYPVTVAGSSSITTAPTSKPTPTATPAPRRVSFYDDDNVTVELPYAWSFQQRYEATMMDLYSNNGRILGLKKVGACTYEELVEIAEGQLQDISKGSVGDIAYISGTGTSSGTAMKCYYFTCGDNAYALMGTYSSTSDISEIDSIFSTVTGYVSATPTPVPTDTPVPTELPAGALAGGNCGTDLTWILGQNGVLTIDGTGDMTNYSLDLSSAPIWTEYADSITSVVINSGVTSIGQEAFRGCKCITNVSIPETVKEIGSSAFYECGSLKQVTIPDNVACIWDMTFYACADLESVTLPAGITFLGDGAFEGCANLNTINFKGTKARWEEFCLGYGNIIPSSATVLCADDPETTPAPTDTPAPVPTPTPAPANAAGIQSVSWFSDSSNKLSVTYRLDSNSFSYYGVGYDIKSVKTGTTVLCSVGGLSYNATAGINTRVIDLLYLENYVLSYGRLATYGIDYTIELVYWYNSTSRTKGIGNAVPFTLQNTTPVYRPSVNPTAEPTATPEPTAEPTAADIIATGDCGTNLSWVLYQNGLLTISGTGEMTDFIEYAYASTAPWHSYSNDITAVVINNGVTSIGDMAFLWCYYIESISIPDTVTSIGEHAFHSCTSLENITIPSSVTAIGARAFDYCIKLKSVTLPDTIKSLGAMLFGDCDGLESIAIPDSITELGEGFFEGCTGLKDVILPDSITAIGNKAFWGCSSLEQIRIPVNVTGIEYSTFYECANLATITIPAGISYIGNNAFKGCTALSTIKYMGTEAQWESVVLGTDAIPSGVTFQYAETLVPTIPEHVHQIDQNDTCSICGEVFSTDGMDVLELPSSVEQVKEEAFEGIDAEAVVFSDGCGSIGSRAFADCPNLKFVFITKSIETIADDAFEGSNIELICKN